MKALPFLRLQEAIKIAARKKEEEERAASLNALMAGRWLKPEKGWIHRLLHHWTKRPEYEETGDEEEAIKRARELLALDKERREKEKTDE